MVLVVFIMQYVTRLASKVLKFQQILQIQEAIHICYPLAQTWAISIVVSSTLSLGPLMDRYVQLKGTLG
jgi:hypothetical protein